ncbi:MAG: cytochrome b [Rhodobacteraceae bacterium]|nr:cytochrome b [Paracoccaceae bacterium]
MNRRTVIKWLHWIVAALVLWFYIFEPEENRSAPGEALSTHAGVGVILAITVVIWFAIFLVKGPAGRPGPKLPNWGKRLHPVMHKALYWGVPAMVLSGALSGLLAPFAIRAFGSLPINFAGGSKALHGLAEELHEVVFNGLILLVVAHALFHIWRHYWLKDNALRIMVPKRLSKYL